MRVRASLARIQERIKAAGEKARRDPEDIQLIVVTKGVPLDPIRQAVLAGAGILGESRIQEALPKIRVMGSEVTWHLIGNLQRNKARDAVGAFDLIHSVDRMALGEELNRRAAQKGITQKILIEVNVAGESSKQGVAFDQVEDLVQGVAALPHLKMRGLMTLPPFPDTPEASRPYYRKLRVLAESIGKKTGFSMTDLSMGMSRDFEVAIEEGATMIRVGTAIFTTGE